MELLLANVGTTGAVRRETVKGREYLVAPMTLIVPGVLSGSRGPLYYPPKEVSKAAEAWNNRVPIVVYHPQDPATGKHLSANSPGVLARSGIGWVRGSIFAGKNKAEGWFDAERTKQVDSRVYDALIKGEPMELSTGLFTENEEKQGVCPITGRAYVAIARNYKPDHLAILPDQQGACSREDGCGLNVNKTQERGMLGRFLETVNRFLSPGNPPATALTPEEVEPKVEVGITKTLNAVDAFVANSNAVANVEQPRHPSDGTYQGKAGKAAQKGFKWPFEDDGENDDSAKPVGDEGGEFGLADRTDNAKDALGHGSEKRGSISVKIPKTSGPSKEVTAKHEELEKSAKEHDSLSHSFGLSGPGTFSNLEKSNVSTFSFQDKKAAKSFSEKHGGSKPEKTPGGHFVSITHNASFGDPSMHPHFASKQAAGASLMAEHDKAHAHGLDAMKASKDDDHEAAGEGHLKAASAHEKEATKIRKGDAEGNPDEHDQAAALHRKAASMHAATRNRGASPPTKGDKTVKLTKEERQGIVNSLVANCTCEDRKTLNALSDQALLTLKNNAMSDDDQDSELEDDEENPGKKKKVGNADGGGSAADGGPSGGTVQSGGEEDENDSRTGKSEGASKLSVKAKGGITGNKGIAERLTPEEMEVWNSVVAASTENKKQIVERLTANVRDKAQREIVANRLMTKPLQDLKDMLLLVPNNAPRQQTQFFGPRVDDSVSTENAGGDPDLLDSPTLNYQEIVTEQRQEKRRTA